MKKFLLGFVVGAATAYVATKLSDEETRNELGEKFDEYKDKAHEYIEQGKTIGKMRSLRTGVTVRSGFRSTMEAVAGKLIDIAHAIDSKQNTQTTGQ